MSAVSASSLRKQIVSWSMIVAFNRSFMFNNVRFTCEFTPYTGEHALSIWMGPYMPSTHNVIVEDERGVYHSCLMPDHDVDSVLVGWEDGGIRAMQMVDIEKVHIRNVDWTVEKYPYMREPVISPDDIVVEQEAKERWANWVNNKFKNSEINYEMRDLLLTYNVPSNMEDVERRKSSGYYFKRHCLSDEHSGMAVRYRMETQTKPCKLEQIYEEVRYTYSGNFINFLSLMLEGDAAPGLFTKYCQMDRKTAYIWETISRTTELDFKYLTCDDEEDPAFSVTIVCPRKSYAARVQPWLVRTKTTKDQPITFIDSFWYHLRQMHPRMKALFLCLFTEYNPSKLYVDVPTFRSVMEGLAEECKKIEEDLAMADTAVEQLVKVDEIIKEVERELPLLDEKISSTEVLEEMAEVVDNMVKPEAWAQVQLKGDNSSLLKGKELIDTNVSGLLEALLPNYLVHRSALFEVIQPMMSCIGFHSEFKNDPVLIWDKWYYPTVHYSGSKESAQSYLGAVELRLAGERADHDPDILSRWNFALWWEAVTESGNLCLENDLGDKRRI